MEKRFQVFVSSTYKDLQEERQEVMQALLELDCIPAGMELFPAADEDQWTLIKQVIDDCDYYIVIIAGRYGSVGSDGIGYTEKEYRYALSTGIPIIAFLHKDPDSLLAKNTERKPKGQNLLKEFRELVQKKMCKHWSSSAELGAVVSRSLSKLIKTTPAVGWVKADRLPDREAIAEILRLQNIIKELEKEKVSPPKGIDDLAQGDDVLEFEYSFYSADKARTSTSWEAKCYTTWNQIFSAIAPRMLRKIDENAFKKEINYFVENYARENFKNDEQLKGKYLSTFEISDRDFHAIKIQLRAIGLIKEHGNFWILTPYGDSVMTTLLAIKKPSKKGKKS